MYRILVANVKLVLCFFVSFGRHSRHYRRDFGRRSRRSYACANPLSRPRRNKSRENIAQRCSQCSGEGDDDGHDDDGDEDDDIDDDENEEDYIDDNDDEGCDEDDRLL